MEYSKNPVNAYLGDIAIEILEKKRKLTANPEIRDKIEELLNHEDIIYFCYGCTYRANRTLKDLLNSDNRDIIKAVTISNIKRCIKLANKFSN